MDNLDDRTPQLITTAIGVMDWDEWIRDIRCTCSDCEDSDSCSFAFDGYNANGDCLAIK